MRFKNFASGYTKAFSIFPNRLKDTDVSMRQLSASYLSNNEKIINDFKSIDNEFKTAVKILTGLENEK